MTWKTEVTDARRAFDNGEFDRSASFLIRAARALRNELVNSLEELEQSHLYVVHYTTLEALYLILQAQIRHVKNDAPDNGYLRMYDSVHLRDPTEGSLLLDCMSEQEYARTLLDEESDPGMYMLSLIRTEDGEPYGTEDRLIHWRAYGDDGSGCSIRFACSAECLVPVVYGEPNAAAAAKQLDQVLEIARELPQDVSSKIRSTLDDHLLNLLAVRYCYKHTAYQLDQEVRVTSLDLDPSKLRPKFEYRRPYVRHFVERDQLSAPNVFKSGTTIIIGPSIPYQADAVRSVERMLEDAGLSGVAVERSEIPYRDR